MTDNSVTIIHKISDFYKIIYQLGKQLNKRDRFGIGQQVENLCLACFELAIEAAYLSKIEKREPLKNLRIKTELLKNLIRLENDLNILDQKKYINLEGRLIEISKMANAWLNWAIGKEDSK